MSDSISVLSVNDRVIARDRKSRASGDDLNALVKGYATTAPFRLDGVWVFRWTRRDGVAPYIVMLKLSDEGLTWARGWTGRDADALIAAQALA